MKITRELVEKARTERGGFLGDVMGILTGSTKPKEGWLERIIGKELTDFQWANIQRLNAEHNEKQRKNGKLPNGNHCVVCSESCALGANVCNECVRMCKEANNHRRAAQMRLNSVQRGKEMSESEKAEWNARKLKPGFAPWEDDGK